MLTTPISEASLFGVAAGMALRGRRPILEIMFGDFIALGFDQVVNGIAKFREMYDDQVTVPLVVRTPMGGRRGYGPTHSQSLEKLLLGVPNIVVVAMSECHDLGGLLVRLSRTTALSFSSRTSSCTGGRTGAPRTATSAS